MSDTALRTEASPVPTRTAEATTAKRTPLLTTALLAAVGGAAIYLAPLAAVWRMAWPYGLLFLALGATQLGTAAGALARPVPRRLLLAATTALVVVALWVLTRLAGVLPGPDPWMPGNSVIGFTDYVCAALESVAVAGLAGVVVLGPRPRRRLWRATATAAVAPLTLVVLLGSFVGAAAASDGLAGAGFPAGAVEPSNLPAGQRSTVEYCRPDGVPLAMDLYMPPAAARTGRPMPVAVYVHGGGTILGDRRTTGLGATLANHEGALFTPMRRQLNARGFMVASIDYRMPPGAPWPASIRDAKCAVRFLRAHAAGLGIDAGRIGAWGGSGGGQLASLLGLARQGAGFDGGQYLDQSSAVQAVVDMFGPADLNDFDDAPPFIRLCLAIGVGDSVETRRAMSPNTYVTANAPPFLVLHGDRDENVFPRHSFGLAERLRAASVPTTLIEVHGTGHSLDTPGQRPSPQQLTDTVTAFFVNTLG
ncbi:alpha/beta hydrolase fold domain-containing protein [Nonomuraea sp. CA-141351]|uniref:alpha/beta hydrolase fold domain-containing protein n=1 Tax=Nonomuraea sp. CA-141351 TaxID=3239996 RepID=UPI003D8A5EF6